MTQPPLEEYLASQPFFSGLSLEFLAFLARCCRERKIEAGEVLFRQGDKAQHFFLIRDGSIAIEVPALTGPTLSVQTLGPSQILGWSWLIAPYRWSFQSRVEAPTVLLEFDGDAILTECEADPAFGYALCKRFAALMSERLEVARQRMMAQWSLPAGFA
ncbi:MAG: cyclic nucleotide-binding domain-containing protein [Gammaproteobacteria bacterium]|nr:cyclic nucleotide-binding domain-containing protein [Gammaproteobacteria bacterium]MCP5426133.1 cyclic nucleotide-binding domain-containing protein [Gammaproteobacteria bacterium]